MGLESGRRVRTTCGFLSSSIFFLSYPTEPAICNWIKRFISTAYSIGNSLTSGSISPEPPSLWLLLAQPAAHQVKQLFLPHLGNSCFVSDGNICSSISMYGYVSSGIVESKIRASQTTLDFTPASGCTFSKPRYERPPPLLMDFEVILLLVFGAKWMTLPRLHPATDLMRQTPWTGFPPAPDPHQVTGRIFHCDLGAKITIHPFHDLHFLHTAQLVTRLYTMVGPVLDGGITDPGTLLHNNFNHPAVEGVSGILWSRTSLPHNVCTLISNDNGALELPNIGNIQPKICLQGKINLYTLGNLYTKDPPDQTALFSAANLLSSIGMTVPKYWRNNSGCWRKPSSMLKKMTPCFSRCSWME